MSTDKINHDEVWSKDRDILFVNRLAGDIGRMQEAGLSNGCIKKAIGTFDYVRVYAETPGFLFPAKSLPKGYKWSDGMKEQQKAGAKSDSRTLVFLPVENDLYIKGYKLIGTNPKECRCVYIKDYRKYTAREIYVEFMHDRMMRDMILKLWYREGLALGWKEMSLKAKGGITLEEREVISYLIRGLHEGIVYFILEDSCDPDNVNGYVVSHPHKVVDICKRGFFTGSAENFPYDADFTPWDEIGKRAFFSKAEAEAKLKETEG